ncbi:MAG: hypothetical protein NC548_55700 [Lachnospiraceae bacterium]|nr:hypothetical protein [Lachnospiraceae bacterium]
MPFALVVTVGNVFLIYIAVATLQFFIDSGFVYGTRAYVVGERSKQEGIRFSHVLVKRHEFHQVIAEKYVSLSLRELDATAVGFSRLHHVSVAYCRPMTRTVERLEFLYYQYGPFKRRQVHYVSSGGEAGHCSHNGEQCHE